MTDVRVVLVTVPDPETGATIGRTLVEERLAACVNLIPGLRSIYRWQGKIEDEGEALMVIKTRAEGLQALIDRIRALHPYTVPEVLALPVEAGFEGYLAWVREETAPR